MNSIINRRTFGKKLFLTAGGLTAVQFFPNLITNQIYAGTALIIDSSGDKSVELSNASFARAFDIGTWSSARLTMRATMQFSGALTSLTPLLAFGFCSGSTNQVMDATTTNYLGLRTTAATWAQIAGTPLNLACSFSGQFFSKRINTTWTNSTAFGTGPYFMKYSELGSGEAGMLLLEVTKGSPNYTGELFRKTEGGGVNITRSSWLFQSVAATPTLTDYTWGSQALAFDESAGTLDHIQIGWSRSEATVNITDLAVIKMS